MGADDVFGDDGDDEVFGGPADDTLHGGDGADFLVGHFGSDTLLGGKGDDTMIGNTFGEPDAVPVSDVCNGQQGQDFALIGSCTVTHAEIVGVPPED